MPPKPQKTLLGQVAPQAIAAQYVYHEFCKLFPDSPAGFYKTLRQHTDSFYQRLGEQDFWQLVAGIAESYKLKWVHQVLTNNAYSWNKEVLALDHVTMTGMSDNLDPLIAQANYTPSAFGALWAKHPGDARGQDITRRGLLDELPILVYEKLGKLNVFDGMRRTCLAAINGKPTITAWVGRITNPQGQPLVNPDRIVFMAGTYYGQPQAAQTHSDLIALIAMAKLYQRRYRNGEQALRRAVKPFSLNHPEFGTLLDIG